VSKLPGTADHSKAERRHGSDPYNTGFSTPVPANGAPKVSRDETVRVATLSSASDLSLQVASLRVELERLVAELETLRRRKLDPGDLHAARLRVQVRDASRCLEQAVDHLMPLEDRPNR